MSDGRTDAESLVLDELFRDLLPPLFPSHGQSLGELDTLATSIATHGLINPLVVWRGENVLLDGYHRYAICRDLEIEPHFVYLEFDSQCDAMIWRIEHHLGRRNLRGYSSDIAQITLNRLVETRARGGN